MLATTPLASQRATPGGAPRPAPVTGRAAAPRIESAVPFRVGETLTYDVSWSSFLVAGTAVMSVKEKRPSEKSTAYYIVVECRPVPIVGRLYTLYYKLDSLVDAYGLLSQYGSLYSEEGDRHRFTSTRFDRPGGRATFERRTDTTVSAVTPVPPQVQDGLAAFYALRGRAFKTGERLTIPVTDHQSLFTATVDVGTIEPVKVPFGQVSAWKLKLTIADAANKLVRKDIAVWVSNDARRMPVKVQAELAMGSFVLALRQAR